MKKVLVLTLVLVMALASSAMAAVTFKGDFTATAEMDNFKLFVEDFELTTGLSVNISASSDEQTLVGEDEEAEAYTNWDFTAGLKIEDSAFKLGKYKLGLYDNYFNAYVWGNDYELSDKATYFSMISAPKKASGIRSRLEVPVLDLGTVTLDFAPADNLRAFANATVEGVDVGLAYARLNWTSETTAKDIIVAQAGYDVTEDINIKGAAGVTLGEDLGIAAGFSADADVTEELNLNGSVTWANEHWVGEGTAVAANNTILKAGATYTESAFQVKANGSYTIVAEDDDKNEVTLSAAYRMSETVAFDKLFDKDNWYKNDAPAFYADVKFANLGFDSVNVKAAAPVVADMVWVKGEASFSGKDDYAANVAGHIAATDKLTLKPFAGYEREGNVIDLKLVADYLIGYSSETALTLTVQKVMTDDDVVDDEGNPVAGELIKASIKVPF